VETDRKHPGVLMIFLLVLALSTATTAVVTSVQHRFSNREAARIGMAVASAFAGAAHLFLATPFIQHLPTWVPLRAEIVLISALAEIALGIALLFPPPTRRRMGIVLALYLLAVFPANVYVAVFDVEVDGQPRRCLPMGAPATPTAVHRLGAVEHPRGKRTAHFDQEVETRDKTRTALCGIGLVEAGGDGRFTLRRLGCRALSRRCR
jgi:uncharacterized membrane protein